VPVSIKSCQYLIVDTDRWFPATQGKENQTSGLSFLAFATQLTDDSGTCTVVVFFRLIGVRSDAFNKTALCDFQSRNPKKIRLLHIYHYG